MKSSVRNHATPVKHGRACRIAVSKPLNTRLPFTRQWSAFVAIPAVRPGHHEGHRVSLVLLVTSSMMSL